MTPRVAPNSSSTAMYHIDRRLLLSAAALGVSRLALAQGGSLPTARRPRPPYRIWFQPRLFLRDPSLYGNMTLDASGWIDPWLCDRAGVTGLRWVYGTNHPDADGPAYWVEECSAKKRASPRVDAKLVAAGVAIDEWVPPQRPEMERFVAEGLRATKQADPELFIAVWVTDLRPTLIELIQDGTADLAIIEGYTHTPKRFGPDAWLHWTTCLRRCDAAQDAGVLERTVFCFGHITDEPNAEGERLSGQWLTDRAHEIRERYPKMPGVAYYQCDSPETPELKELVARCDKLSGLWK